MPWTAPQTWTTSQVVTAADMNTDIRDNMLETAAATATTAGDIVYADAANSMGSRVAHPGTGRMLVSDASSALAWRQVAEDINFTDGSTTYSDTTTTYSSSWGLAGEGGPSTFPSVTVTTGTAAIVIVSARVLRNDTAGGLVYISYSVSGATTTAATDTSAATFESSGVNDVGTGAVIRLATLTAGSNTFQMEAKVSAGTGTIIHPRILVIPL